ncbi:hypothetical protein AUP68_08186 [Ilyonectria robusta]
MRTEPFRVRFIPKSEKSIHIIQSEAVVAREFLRQYDGETRVAMKALEEVGKDDLSNSTHL